MSFYIVVVATWIEDLIIIYDVIMLINNKILIQLFEDLGAINHN